MRFLLRYIGIKDKKKMSQNKNVCLNVLFMKLNSKFPIFQTRQKFISQNLDVYQYNNNLSFIKAKCTYTLKLTSLIIWRDEVSGFIQTGKISGFDSVPLRPFLPQA